MTYEQRKDVQPEECKRACGVQPQTCEKLLHVLQEQERQQRQPGRPTQRSLEAQRFLTRQYWRAYRPSCHSGLSWGDTASVGCRTVPRMEHLLSQSQVLHLPGKKPVLAGGTQVEVSVVDVAASPVERPPKNSGAPTVASRSVTPRKPSLSSRPSPARASASPVARDGSTLANGASGAASP